MKFLLAIIPACFLFVSIDAQQDPQAIAGMEKMAAITNAASSIFSNFSYHYSNSRTKEDYSTDGLIWLKGSRYKISLPDNDIETYYDGTTLYNYLSSSNELNVSTPDPKADDFFMNNPLGLFHLYQKDYKLKYVQDVEGTSDCIIDLYPLDIKKPYHRIRLTLDKISGMLKIAQASGKNGELYEVKLTNLKTDKKLEDSFFIFDKSKHPGVVVIDLRN
jgi:outer membrane lipoprotein carrier protein